jgi:hypothetical protein
MKSILLSLVVVIALFSSCQKQDLTQTRVGFYVLNPDYVAPNDGYVYNLYIDNQFSGTLQVSTTKTDDSTMMNFHTLDAQRHDIQVKKGNTLVSSTYVQIGKCQTKSGTGLQIENYKNGFTFKNLTNMSYATYGIFQ